MLSFASVAAVPSQGIEPCLRRSKRRVHPPHSPGKSIFSNSAGCCIHFTVTLRFVLGRLHFIETVDTMIDTDRSRTGELLLERQVFLPPETTVP